MRYPKPSPPVVPSLAAPPSGTNTRSGSSRSSPDNGMDNLSAGAGAVPADLLPDTGPRELWVIPPQDRHGHTERLWFRVSPVVYRHLASIIEGHFYPYRTRGDLLRHALHRHLAWLEAQNHDTPSIIHSLDMINTILRDSMFQSEMESMFRDAGARVQQMLGNDELGEAVKLLAQVKSAIDHMPEGALREKFADRFGKQFGSYLTGKKANLLGEEGETEEEDGEGQ